MRHINGCSKVSGWSWARIGGEQTMNCKSLSRLTNWTIFIAFWVYAAFFVIDCGLHSELWNQDWRRDGRWFRPAFGLLTVTMAAVVFWGFREDRRRKRLLQEQQQLLSRLRKLRSLDRR